MHRRYRSGDGAARRRAYQVKPIAPDTLAAMRAWVVAVAVLVLVAGCSKGVSSRPETSSRTSSPTARSSSTTPTTSTTAPQKPPAAGAPMADVIAWVQAGAAADPNAFHSATREGQVTQLQNADVAFTTPSGKTSCMTDSMFGNGDLACLVLNPVNPPPEPPDTYGQWTPGWSEFDGTTLTLGGVHGDPGRFIYGDGAVLPYGQSLKFGDYQCRSDQAGVFCVNYAHQSAARINDAGVQAFGCLQPVTPPPSDVGLKFSC
jgi:hypothetical protein